MTRLYSFASWNVEHFKNAQARADRIAGYVSQQDPDVFAIYEVESKAVFSHFTTAMPSHHFFITESLGGMDILIGIRNSMTAFVSQRERLRSRIPTLRPGVLVTLKASDNSFHSLLFIHIKSSDAPHSFGLRDDMVGHILNLKKALDKAAGGSANFVAIGDFNTMGMNLTYSPHDVDAAEELERFRKRFEVRDMQLLDKDQSVSWWGGGTTYPPSNLDHAFASDGLKFAPFGAAKLSVRGWPEFTTQAEQLDWIEKYSDHAMLYGEVHNS